MDFDKEKLLKFKKSLTIDDIYKIFPEIKVTDFEKYVRPTLNFVNSRITNSKTDSRHIGQLSDLFQKYLASLKDGVEPKVETWKRFYLNYPNVFDGVKSIDKTVIENNVKTGQQAFKLAVNNIIELIKFLSKEIIGNRLTNKIVEKWVEDLMFTKTFQGFYVEKPIVNLVCKLIFEVNDSVENFKQVKLRKSIAEEETKGIDYIYEDGSLILNFQVKSGESDASFLRKTSHAISKLPNDVYCCIYTKKEDGKIKLTVKYNDAILLNV